jgi:hypothetical protein
LKTTKSTSIIRQLMPVEKTTRRIQQRTGTEINKCSYGNKEAPERMCT